jgi:hypothetical protein
MQDLSDGMIAQIRPGVERGATAREIESIPELARGEGMEPRHPRAAPEEIHASPAQLLGARAGQEEPCTPRLDEPMHLVQQFRKALDLVEDDHTVFRTELFREPPRVLAEGEEDGRVQQVVHLRARQRLAIEGGLAGLPGAEEEVIPLGQEKGKVQRPRIPVRRYGVAWRPSRPMP